MSEYLKNKIAETGLSQGEFAEAAGVSLSSLNSLLNGNRVGDKTLYRVAVALEEDLESVFIPVGAIPPNWVEAIVQNWNVVILAIEDTGFPSPEGKLTDWSDHAWEVTDALRKGGKKLPQERGDDSDYEVVMREYRPGGRLNKDAGKTFTAGLGVTVQEQADNGVGEALEGFLKETERISGDERQKKGEKDSGTDTNL